MAEPKTREWPLIAFTVGLQVAAGIELSTALARWRVPEITSSLTSLVIAVFPIVLLAGVVSLFHLGRPYAAWRAFRNLSQSRLSREVIIYSIFCTLALAQFVNCLLYGISSPGLTTISAVVGVAAVVASARIYALPAQQLWNSGLVTGSFIGATLLLGGVFINIAVTVYISGAMALAGAIVFLASSFGMLARILHISRFRYANPETPPILQTKHWLSFCGLVLGTVIPILGILANYHRVPFTILTAIIVVFGVVLGRALMYSRGAVLARF